MTQVTVNGNTYSDDGTTPKDMLGRGYAKHFFPMVADTMVRVADAEAAASSAAASASAAAGYAAALFATSASSVDIGTGGKTFTIQTSKQFVAGQWVKVMHTGGNEYMWGIVSSYSGTTLVVDVQLASGSGTYADWTIGLSGPQGATGPIALMPAAVKTDAYTAVVNDIGTQFECSGTWTFSFSPAATLGNGWYCTIVNTSTGIITLDPSGSEQIAGASTYALPPGQRALVVCTGSAFSISLESPSRFARLPILQVNTGWTPASVLEDLVTSVEPTGLSGTAYATVTTSSSLLIASSNGSTAYVATSSGDGNWTLRAMPSVATWNVGTSGDYCFAFANGGTATAVSSNGGATWASATALPGNGYGKPVRIGGLWLVPTNSKTYYTSADGVAWTTRTAPVSVFYFYVVGGVVYIYESGTTGYTSEDGINWTSRTLPAMPKNATTLAVDSDGALQFYTNALELYRSTDGINWSALGITLPDDIGMPVTINGVRCVGGTNNPAYTWDGTRWTKRSSVVFIYATSARQFGGKYYLGGANSLVYKIAYGSAGATGLFTR